MRLGGRAHVPHSEFCSPLSPSSRVYARMRNFNNVHLKHVLVTGANMALTPINVMIYALWDARTCSSLTITSAAQTATSP